MCWPVMCCGYHVVCAGCTRRCGDGWEIGIGRPWRPMMLCRCSGSVGYDLRRCKQQVNRLGFRALTFVVWVDMVVHGSRQAGDAFRAEACGRRVKLWVVGGASRIGAGDDAVAPARKQMVGSRGRGGGDSAGGWRV